MRTDRFICERFGAPYQLNYVLHWESPPVLPFNKAKKVIFFFNEFPHMTLGNGQVLTLIPKKFQHKRHEMFTLQVKLAVLFASTVWLTRILGTIIGFDLILSTTRNLNVLVTEPAELNAWNVLAR